MTQENRRFTYFISSTANNKVAQTKATLAQWRIRGFAHGVYAQPEKTFFGLIEQVAGA